MTEAVKKKKKRKPKRAVTQIFALVLICISGFLLTRVYSEISMTIELKADLDAVNREMAIVDEENALLNSRKEKLEDPEYVQSYARGNYMVSKEGEKIFILHGSDD